MKAWLLVLALACGCHDPQDKELVTETIQSLSRIEAQLNALHTLPLQPYKMESYRFGKYEGLFLLNQQTGETWVYLRGSTNNPSGWAPVETLVRIEMENPELDLQPVK